MSAKLLFLGASDEDFEILRQRVKPAPETEIKFVFIGRVFPEGHPQAGMLCAVSEVWNYRPDAIIYSEHIGDPHEREAIFDAVFDRS